MIDKKIFVETINFIKEKNKKMDKVDNALYKISRGFWDLSGLFFDYENQVIKLLESLAPKDNAFLINWWVHETSFGKKNTKLYDKYGKVIANLKTAEDLYNYVFEEKE